MDKMEEWELVEFFDVLDYSGFNSWEQTRMLLSCYADRKKVKKLSDIIRFPWDAEYKNNDKNIEISNEQIQHLKKKAEYFSKILYKTT